MRFFSRRNKRQIEFCTNNLNQFYDDEAFDRLEDFIEENGIKVKEMDCLSYCDECTYSPYALVNREFIDAETPEELMKKVKEKLG